MRILLCVTLVFAACAPDEKKEGNTAATEKRRNPRARECQSRSLPLRHLGQEGHHPRPQRRRQARRLEVLRRRRRERRQARGPDLQGGRPQLRRQEGHVGLLRQRRQRRRRGVRPRLRRQASTCGSTARRARSCARSSTPTSTASPTSGSSTRTTSWRASSARRSKNGKVDVWEYYEGGKLDRIGYDTHRLGADRSLGSRARGGRRPDGRARADRRPTRAGGADRAPQAATPPRRDAGAGSGRARREEVNRASVCVVPRLARLPHVGGCGKRTTPSARDDRRGGHARARSRGRRADRVRHLGKVDTNAMPAHHRPPSIRRVQSRGGGLRHGHARRRDGARRLRRPAARSRRRRCTSAAPSTSPRAAGPTGGAQDHASRSRSPSTAERSPATLDGVDAERGNRSPTAPGATLERHDRDAPLSRRHRRRRRHVSTLATRRPNGADGARRRARALRRLLSRRRTVRVRTRSRFTLRRRHRRPAASRRRRRRATLPARTGCPQ